MLFAIMVLVIGAGAEELLPKFAGVGFPVLFAAVPFLAMRYSTVAVLGFAVAAGAMEESISSLPPMAGVVYFVAVALLSQWSRLSWVAAAFAYPCYQLWLAIWVSDLGSGIFTRFIASVPIGVMTAMIVAVVLGFVERKAAMDEHR